MQNTYWHSKGKHQEIADKLQRLIPVAGEVFDPRGSNRRLEKFRKAANCYYDLYNNGLWNRANEFRAVFGIASKPFKRVVTEWNETSKRLMTHTEIDFDAIAPVVEPIMDKIILEAAVEQNIL